ncbi:MAG: PKD domain-containing protein, partial [Flavobacteriales bacterium]
MKTNLLRILAVLPLFTWSIVFGQNVNMQNGSSTQCSGTFYDSGGNGGTYLAGQNLTYTFCPSTPGADMVINFTTFNLENNFDFLFVYDGNSTAAPSLGTYTGTTGPGLVQASPTNPTGCITFRFTSDGSIQNSGWVAAISCATPCVAPTATITSTTPAASGGIIRICQGGTVNFSGTISGGPGGADTYAWNFGNGATSGQANPTATFPSAGSYQVSLNGTEGGCQNTNSATVIVQVSTTPTFTTSASPTTICLGQSANLNAAVTMNPFVPNCTPPVSGTTFLPDGSGVSYTTAINVNCYNAGQTVTSTSNISNVCLTMEHSYLGDLQITLICPNGQSMILKSYANGGNGTYLGSPLDDPAVGPGIGSTYCFTPTASTLMTLGGTTTAGSPAGNSILAGNYQPTDPFTNLLGCPLNGAWTIQVTDNLGADNGYIFNWDVNFTVPAATGSFTPTIVSQGWNAAAGLTNTGSTTASVTPTLTGNQCYTYSVTDNFGCTYSSSPLCITVNPNVPVNAGPDLTACAGQTITIGGSPTGGASTTYSWAETQNNSQIAISGSTTSANPTVTLNAAATGTVQYTVTGTLAGCVTTDVMQITVTPPPTVSVNSPIICAGQTATVTATPGSAGTYTYTWSVPGGAANPGNVASFSTTVAGIYTVSIAAGSCTSSPASGTVIVNAVPTVTVNNPVICAGGTATVTATPGVTGTYTYIWTVPMGMANPGNVASLSTTTAGSYSVTISAAGCTSSSVSGTVTVNPVPTVTVNSPTVCAGTSATVTAIPGSTGTYTYTWTVPSGVTNPGNVPSFSTTTAGTYTVTISASGCTSAPISGTVTVNPVPTVSVNSPTVCAGTSATVTATPGVAGTYTYTWSVPGGVTNPGDVPSFQTTTAGSYSVTIAAAGCTSAP